MRATDRVVAGLLGLVLATGVCSGGLGTAHAAEDAFGRALPEREITSKIKDLGNRLVLRGNVSPGHARKVVVVQKRTCATDDCTWYAWETVRTNDRGGFKQRVTAPKEGYFYWRAKVKRYGGYGTSYSDVWRTYTV